jgi:DNA-binding CsgD family transcriptional regulator
MKPTESEYALLFFLRQDFTEMQSRAAVELLSSNGSNEIARKLNKSINTIRSHKKAIFGKFKVHNRGDFIRECYKLGLKNN